MLVSSSPPMPERPPQKRQTSLLGKMKEALQRSKAGVNSASTMMETIAAPPPNTGDGLTENEAKALSDKPQNSKGLLPTMMAQAQSGTLVSDASTLLAVLESATGEIDDREMLLERIVTLLQGLPSDSSLQQTITETLLKMLWNDLSHPPSSFLSSSKSVNPKDKGELSLEYVNHRKADGSGNNPLLPTLGSAATPYARTVPPLHPANPNRPDPSIVFDALLKRETFKPHPSGISSLLFSFATIIIHSCFQTSRTDPNINEASSYLDLSPLYGNNLEEQKTVRTFSQGLLHPDVIASPRLFFMPPSVVALLVMFSRNHNFICEKLYKINEKGKYKAVDSLSEEDKKKQDEDLFNTARLINCGYFLEIIVQDYIRVILNINQTESTWSLNPNIPISTKPNGQAPRGTGNAVSAEFNLVYRWHSAISQKDEKWIEGLFKKYCGDKPIDELTEKDFMTALSELAKTQGKDPKTWTIPGIERTHSGRFNDRDLANILSDATEEVAGAFGAHGSPPVMRVIDVLGMSAARNDWNVCSMNEFRRFLNLKPFETFEQWNPDPVIANAARMLYGHTENLELFPGLHAEAAKPSQSGSGLAPGYTISRAILSDAVALVRGDRFYTVDYNSATLTNWGYQDVQPDVDGGSYGGMIGKLLMRNLPDSYTPNSTYALFPFTIPSRMNGYLAKNGVLDKYDTRRPTSIPPVHSVFTYNACLDILADPRRFGVIYEKSIKSCSNDYGYFISFDDAEQHNADRKIQENALFAEGWQDGVKSFYSETTRRLIKEKSWSYDTNKTFTLDVVRDVTNLASVYWVSHQFGMPIKDSADPHGLFTPQELYLILSAFFISVFMNFDSTAGFRLSQAAKKAAPVLLAIIKGRLMQVKGVPAALDDLARSVQDYFVGKEDTQGVVMGKNAHAYYTRLLESGRPFEQLEASVQSTMTASVSNQGQAAAHVINFFLDDKNSLHKEELIKLIRLSTTEADQKILSLVSEAMRLDPQVPLIPRVAREDATIIDGDRTVNVKKGDFVFPSMLSAGMDPAVFPNPDQVQTRDPSLYRLFGSGMHTCLGARIVNISLVAMIKEVFSLPNIRRAPGAAGQLRRFHQEVGGTECPVYLDAKSSIWPLPVSLSVVYDSQ